MKYILDFDGVIFNTQALKLKMHELGIEESLRSASLFETLKKHSPQEDISAFVFADAYTFIREHSEDSYIVSSFVSTNPLNNQNAEIQKEYQQTKINLAGITALVGEDHVHVVGESKAEALQELKALFDSHNEECVFIDDRQLYIKQAESLGITAVWMDKSVDGERGKPYVINSFEGFKEKLTLWKM